MLYVTTRSNQNTYTAAQAICGDRSPDGGFYVPQRLPELDRDSITALAQRSFNRCLADAVNLLLDTQLTDFDVDFTIGRSTARLSGLPHRLWLGECWHNLAWDFERTVANLWRKVCPEGESAPGSWFRIALGVGVIFGFFGKLMRKGAAGVKAPIDISVPSGDFTWPMAAWYARSLGLPIANIVVSCNENYNTWELLHHGALRNNLPLIETDTPLCDHMVPEGIERFVFSCGGVREVQRFLECCREGRMYVPSDMTLEAMRSGMKAAVVGQDRMRSAIPNVYRSHAQVLEPYTALAYSGLLDYRAGTGESRAALILSVQGPGKNISYVSALMGIQEEELKTILNH